MVLDPVPERHFAALAITYDVGASDVPVGWTGLAHLSEHVMFSGTDTFDDVSIHLHFDAIGAVFANAETQIDRTVFYELIPATALDWALYVESHRMARTLAGLTRERVDRQREVVTSEGWQRGIYGWLGLLERTLARATYGENHPYASAVEDRIDVEGIRLEQVQWFVQQNYRPDRAVLTVVGGFDPSELRASIERYFGPVVTPPTASARPTVSIVVPRTSERRIELDVPDARDLVVLAWPTAALDTPPDAALDVAALILGDRLHARLFSTGVVYAVSAEQQSHTLGSMFRIALHPMPGHSVTETITAVDTIVEELRSLELPVEIVDRAAGRMIATMERGREDLLLRARLLARGSTDMPMTLEAQAARYRSVSPESVQEAVRLWLPRAGRSVVVARSAPHAFELGTIRTDRTVRGEP